MTKHTKRPFSRFGLMASKLREKEPIHHGRGDEITVYDHKTDNDKLLQLLQKHHKDRAA